MNQVNSEYPKYCSDTKRYTAGNLYVIYGNEGCEDIYYEKLPVISVEETE